MKRLLVLTGSLIATILAAAITLIPGPDIDAQVGAALGCESDINHGWCEAGPVGDEFDYEWTSDETVVSLHQGVGNFRRYCCLRNGGGRISVAVTHPDGQRFISTEFVNCYVGGGSF